MCASTRTKTQRYGEKVPKIGRHWLIRPSHERLERLSMEVVEVSLAVEVGQMGVRSFGLVCVLVQRPPVRAHHPTASILPCCRIATAYPDSNSNSPADDQRPHASMPTCQPAFGCLHGSAFVTSGETRSRTTIKRIEHHKGTSAEEMLSLTSSPTDQLWTRHTIK
jgi:hypothetical protein